MTAAADIALAPEDRLRADLYNFIGLLLARPPDQLLLDQCAALTGDETTLGQAITALSTAARKARPKALTQEFNVLFIGLGRGELLPYASYYLTGFLNEKPLARLRADMTALGMTRADNVYEPEDNIASLMEMMAGMIVGRFRAPASLPDQRQFFNKHLAPWAGHFFADLEAAKGAQFYTAVGRVGRAFMEIEREAFRMTA
ncbi:TorD/DmsD family molecular chaperone [Yoonia sp. 2307UL14-13]|uniref:TorD/DmsD family molecular chaperone n=1 Tax=Yoonia sp. 2307UL14-13 TaxID=3126506 RepID=UPI00309851AF